MSDFGVKIRMVSSVLKHPNADNLDILKISGWSCISKKGNFKAGDLGVYFPVNSVLPKELENAIEDGSKIRLSRGRVKAIKLRGVVSEGLFLSIETVEKFKEIPCKLEGSDLIEMLGVIKFEESKLPKLMQGEAENPKYLNIKFKQYTDIKHYKDYLEFLDGEDTFIVTEKVHGTNFRAGWVPTVKDTWIKKIKGFFRVLPKWEFVFGSRRVQLKSKGKYEGFYKENVYSRIVEKYDLKNRIPKGYVCYGEIFGDSIQKGYNYSQGEGEIDVVFFDVYDHVTCNYLDFLNLMVFLLKKKLPVIPCFGCKNIDFCKNFGPSKLDSATEIEGYVVRSLEEKHIPRIGRCILKIINPEFLLKDNSEFH